MADTSSVSAIIKNGEVVNSGIQTEDQKAASKTTPNGYDKDAFMQILVAQMKYQDPMEPTSNTEYISQYATFTQVEQLSNMANAMSLSRASEMVGKTVVITQKNADNGTTSEVQGVVDYVTYSGNKAYLNINGTAYDIDNVSQVLATDYVDALEAVEDFQKAIDKLPNLDMITEEEHGETIDNMYAYYNDVMDKKAKNLMNKNYVTSLLQYVNRIDDIREDGHRTFKKEEA
jgi:flagellar basal-body rod modification protein FlgD